MVHVTAADALIDPHITIRHEDALPKKDPRYKPVPQQGTFERDRTRRVITDYTGTPIIKVDQEGGIFDQQLRQGIYKTVETDLGAHQSRARAKSNSISLPGVRAKDGKLVEVSSNLSTRGLLQRKLYLMKLMLKNEKKANSAIKQRIDELSNSLHKQHDTVEKLGQQVHGQKTIFRM